MFFAFFSVIVIVIGMFHCAIRRIVIAVVIVVGLVAVVVIVVQKQIAGAFQVSVLRILLVALMQLFAEGFRVDAGRQL